MFHHPINATHDRMTSINKFNDAEIFALKFVAFRTTSYNFLPHCGYVLDNSGTRYALIGGILTDYKDGDIGYKLSILLNAQDIPCDMYLFDSLLKNANMQMRLASKKELYLIKEAITNNIAHITFIADELKPEIINLINNQISSIESIPHIGCKI